MTSLKTSIKTITYLSDTGCLEIQGASLFRKFAGNPYKLHTYTSQESFQDAMSRISFAAVLFFFFVIGSGGRGGLSLRAVTWG